MLLSLVLRAEEPRGGGGVRGVTNFATDPVEQQQRIAATSADDLYYKS